MKNTIITLLWFATTGALIWLFIHVLMGEHFLALGNESKIIEVVIFGALGSIASSYVYLTLLNKHDSVLKNGSIIVLVGIITGVFIKIGFTTGEPQGLVALPVIVLITVAMFGIIIFPLGIFSLYMLSKITKINKT